jgi:hypothetical protein
MMHRGGAFLGEVGNSGVKKGEPDTPRGGGKLIKTRGKLSCLEAGEKNRGFQALSLSHLCFIHGTRLLQVSGDSGILWRRSWKKKPVCESSINSDCIIIIQLVR